MKPIYHLSLSLFFFLSVSAFGQCPDSLLIAQGECETVQVTLVFGGEVNAVIWYWGDGSTSDGTLTEAHTYAEPGDYNLCVEVYTTDCPDGNEICQAVVIPDCSSNCELDMEVLQDGDILYLTPFDYPDNATIFWSVNGEGFGPGEEFTFDLSELGTYQICAAYETPECPEGVFWCETWTVEGEGDCPDEGDFGYEMMDCDSYIFEIGSFVEGAEVFWNFGDGDVEWAGHVADHTYDEDGVYSVWALYNSPFCEDSIYFQETIEVDCGVGNDCELDMEVLQDGDILYFTPFNYPDNATIFWSVNGEGFGPGEEFIFDLSEPGTYQICAAYETPECPEAVTWCETWIVDNDDCPFELSVEETEECGCYELSLNEQWGGQYIWNLGDTSFTSFSNTVLHCYEPGNYTGYVQILESNYPECEQDPVVFSIEVPECEEPDCYWFNFQLSNNIPGVSFDLDWSVTDLNNEPWGDGTIEVEGDSTTYTGEICVGTGCYILEFEAPVPIVPENLDIDFVSIIDPIIPVTIEWVQDDNPYTVTGQIGIAETCNWPVSVDENGLELTQIYPLPAHDFVNIKLNHEVQTNLRLYNINGEEVLRQNIQQSGTIDVSSLPAGIYLLQLQQGNNFKTFSIPLLN